MPVIICKQCGGITNTAISIYDLENGYYGCIAKIEEDTWVHGCAYGLGEKWIQEYADKLIGTKLPTKEDMIKSMEAIVANSGTDK